MPKHGRIHNEHAPRLLISQMESSTNITECQITTSKNHRSFRETQLPTAYDVSAPKISRRVQQIQENTTWEQGNFRTILRSEGARRSSMGVVKLTALTRKKEGKTNSSNLGFQGQSSAFCVLRICQGSILLQNRQIFLAHWFTPSIWEELEKICVPLWFL